MINYPSTIYKTCYRAWQAVKYRLIFNRGWCLAGRAVAGLSRWCFCSGCHVLRARCAGISGGFLECHI